MKKRETLFLLSVIFSVQLIGMLRIDLMEHDATQYATISMQMLQNNSWLQIFWREVSYLDKPPLLFWLSAISFKVFGINHFAYRLPSFLVLLLGIYSLWRLTRRLYDMPTANLAVLIFSSLQAIFLITHDVRTDTMLAGWLTFSIWQLHVYLENRNRTAFLFAFAAIGLAMLTKGPLGLVIPVLAFAPQLVLQKRWDLIFNPFWLVGLAVVILLLSPMLYGLYAQHGYEGIEFFFWKQSFGRITGENVWRDESGPFFFVHSFIWSFIPWTLPAIYAMYRYVRNMFQNPRTYDSFLIWVSLLVFIAMSNATYKLPHYVFVVYPFIAIMTARILMQYEKAIPNLVLKSQYATLVLLMAIMVFLTISDFSPAYAILLAAGLISGVLIILKSYDTWISYHRMIMLSLLLIITGNAMLNIGFYPELLNHQSGGMAGRQVKTAGIPESELCFFDYHSPSFDFYSQRLIPFYSDTIQLDSALKIRQHLTCFTGIRGMETLKSSSYKLTNVDEFKEYKATKLSLPWFFPSKREDVLRKTYLITIAKKRIE